MKRALLAFSLGILAATILSILPVQAAWAAPNYKVLHAFGAGKDGGGLWTSVTLDKKGDLYGATSGGGAYAYGTVFRLAPHPNGNWTETVLHSFKNGDPDGSEPNGGLVQDPSGKWYGTTSRDGAYHGGTAFQLTHEPNGWKANVIYAFGEKSDDGGFPMAGLIMDGTGNLYGTTPKGSPWSTAFELTPDSGGWKETVIYRFCASSPNCADGTEPQAGLILDAKGNLFGTTAGGGTGCGAGGCGTVYELQRTSSGWKEVVLHRFNNDGKDGVEPGWGALAMNGRGSLYGTTFVGGSAGYGTVFSLSRRSNGRWKETVLYNFGNDSNGSGPGGGVVMDKASSLYGTTTYGGSGCGVVYKLAPGARGKWAYTVLHSFGGSDGCQPDANLILDSKGNLYGTTATGGVYGAGVVFEVTP